MLTGLYQWDREPVKAYIRHHGAEPPGDGWMDFSSWPLFCRLLHYMRFPGRLICAQRGRLRILRDGTWTLLHYDFDAKDWIPGATGLWREGEQAVRFSVQEVLGESPAVSDPGELDVVGDRLLLPRGLVGSMFGLIGFRLVSPLPEM